MREGVESEILVILYNPAFRQEWNNFNRAAANGLFLFDRDYMEYHQDRFTDFSVLIYLGEKLVAVCPINTAGKVAHSHTGLTFGGLLVSKKVKTHTYLRCFAALLTYLQKAGLQKFVYKPIPYIFHQLPVLDDQYALFLHNARLINRSVSSFIDLSVKPDYTKGRKWSLNQGLKEKLEIKESQDYEWFMQLVTAILVHKFEVKPTHTAPEINCLARKFPENIKFIGVYQNQELIGGSIVYLSNQVVHMQYIATNAAGKKHHALDLIVHFLISKYKKEKKYISFGISPGSDEFKLNTGLIQNKESFGARSIPHDIYEINL